MGDLTGAQMIRWFVWMVGSGRDDSGWLMADG